MDISDIATGAKDALTVSRVFGEPYERDGLMVIPVAAVRGAAGGGSGETEDHDGNEQEGVGGGFALTARPVGAYVVGNGNVRWEPALDVTKVVLGGQAVGIVLLLVLRQLVKRVGRRR